MSRLIFSSYSFRSYFMFDAFRKVIKDSESKSILIIPWASATSKLTGERERLAAKEMGFREEAITVWGTPEDYREDKLEQYDYLMVLGGNPFRLLDELRRLGVIEPIRRVVQEGKVTYIGVSAGAYVACPSIEYAQLLEGEVVLRDTYSALNLIDGVIICHFGVWYIDAYIQYREKGLDVFIVSDEGVATVNDGEWEYLEPEFVEKETIR